MYKVRWKGTDANGKRWPDDWIPKKDIQAENLIRAYEKKKLAAKAAKRKASSSSSSQTGGNPPKKSVKKVQRTGWNQFEADHKKTMTREERQIKWGKMSDREKQVYTDKAKNVNAYYYQREDKKKKTNPSKPTSAKKKKRPSPDRIVAWKEAQSPDGKELTRLWNVVLSGQRVNLFEKELRSKYPQLLIDHLLCLLDRELDSSMSE